MGIVKISLNFEIYQFWKNLFINLISNFVNNTNKSQAKLIEFLGLKDKNGKTIHFGDILADSRNNLLTPVCEIENGEHILFFKPVQHLDKKMSIGCKSTYSNTLEIVGNIYTNCRKKQKHKIMILLQQKSICVNTSGEYCYVKTNDIK